MLTLIPSFTTSSLLLAAASLAYSAPQITQALTQWSSALDRLGIDRTLEDGRLITEQLAALASDRDIDYITARIESGSTRALLKLPLEDRQLLFSEVVERVSPEMYIQIRNETNAIDESIGVTRPVRLAILNGDDAQIHEDFYTSQFRSQHWWRALSLGQSSGEQATSYQVFYPGQADQASTDSSQADLLPTIRTLRPHARISRTQLMAQWSLPGKRLPNYTQDNRVPFTADTVMRFGGLSVMGVSAEDLPALVDKPHAARLVDVLMVSGRMGYELLDDFHHLLYDLQPRMVVVNFTGEPASLNHGITEVLSIADIDDEFGRLVYDPQSEQITANVHDATSHQVLRTASASTAKEARITEILRDERIRYIDELATQLEGELGPQGNLVLMAGAAVNDVIDEVAAFLLAWEQNPYPSFQETLGQLSGAQADYEGMLNRLFDDDEFISELSHRGIKAFAHILGAWGMRGS